jgi:hypothetical protein
VTLNPGLYFFAYDLFHEGGGIFPLQRVTREYRVFPLIDG